MAITWLKKSITLLCKGMLMGIADLIPGISGGTVALLAGIYDDLLLSIQSFNWTSLQILFQKGFFHFWKAIHGPFLLPLGIGILLSIFFCAHIVHFLLHHFPAQLWAFFLGMMGYSLFLLVRTNYRNTRFFMLFFLTGAFVIWYITHQLPPNTHHHPSLLFYFFTGMIAMCAMILPGLSGSFILILIGVYRPLLQAVINVHIPTLVLFAMGGLLGLFIFTRILSFFLSRYRGHIIALMSGFIFGALPAIWPWKNSYLTGQTYNISPWKYLEYVGFYPFLTTIISLTAGFLCVVCIYQYSHLTHKI